MTKEQKIEILVKFKEFFVETITVNHLKNLKKLKKLSAFKYNPFLFKYLAKFLTGKSDAKELAKILIYPRILGTSINTSFGQNLQNAAPNIFQSVLGSTTQGIDLEFIDQIDKRKKYCQIKSGPQTINNDDVDTIKNHFKGLKGIARVNNVKLGTEDLIVGILFGTEKQLSGNYKLLMQEYPLFIGKEFWYRLTGDEGFYSGLIEEFGNAANEVNSKTLLEKQINVLAADIEINFINKELNADFNREK